MNEPRSKVNANKLLDELLKTTSSCYGCFGKSEEWSGVEVNEVKKELEKASEKADMNGCKTYVLSDGKKKQVSNDLVKNHQESLLNVNMIDIDSRNGKNEVEIDFRFKYLDEIVKYMKNEYDISELNGVEFIEFCRELIEMNIPFRMDIMNRLCTGFNENGVAWQKRCVVVNENEYKVMMKYMNIRLGDLQYNGEKERDEIVRNTLMPLANEILNDFDNYLKAPSKYVKNDKLKIDDIINLLSMISIDTSNEIIRQYLLNYTISLFCYGTKVLENSDYDDKLREWLGSDYKWRLIYRASEHGYTAKSFHEYCNNKGPTLIMIKSDGGWIFGGYTTQSWSGKCIYYDMTF